jgi:hypothetical protein
MLAPGGRVHLAPVAAADPADPDMTVPRHDPEALADAIGAVLAELDAQPGQAPREAVTGRPETRRSNPWR